jgi:arginine/ornithine transport system permease protein
VGVVRFELALQHWEVFASGVWMTLHLTALCLLIGGCIAIPVAFAMLRGGVSGWLATGYVYLFRGTPLLVQLYLVYYGLSQFDFIRETWFWRPPA